MNPRTTGIVFAVAAALFAFIYLYEIGGEEARREAEESESRLFPELEAEDVEAIAFTTSDGVRARVARVEGGWELREPLVFPGDEFAVDAMAAALADLKSERVFESPQAPEVYGLGASTPELRFEAGGAEHVLRFGNKTPMDSNHYAAVAGDPAVYGVASFTVNALRKSLTELREKRVMRFDQSAVDRIEASWRGGGRVVLEASGEGWRLLEPIQDRADDGTVEALLGDLSFLRATGFEDEAPPDAEVGLDDPEWIVRLSGKAAVEGADAFELSLAIGDAVDGESRLVRGSTPSLYRIPAERLADFPRELVAYRYKQLSRYPPTEASRIELVFERLVSSEEGDEPLEIVGTRGETGWESAPERFKPGRLAQLVNELARLSGDDILFDQVPEKELERLGLAPPRVRIRVFGDAEEPLGAVEIGAVRPEEGIVARPEGGRSVYLLGPGLGDVLPTSLESFRDEFRSEEQPFAEEEAEGDAAPETQAPAD